MMEGPRRQHQHQEWQEPLEEHNHKHALIGFIPTPTHPSALHTRARPCLLSRH